MGGNSLLRPSQKSTVQTVVILFLILLTSDCSSTTIAARGPNPGAANQSKASKLYLPADGNAKEQAHNILQWLSQLPEKSTKKIVAGQFGRVGIDGN